MLSVKKNKSHQEHGMHEFLIIDDAKSHRSTNIEMPKLRKNGSEVKKMQIERQLKNFKKYGLPQQILEDHSFSLVSYKDTEPEKFKILEQNAYTFSNYDILDLTYSLICSEINKKVLLILYVTQVVIRYFSILCLVSITVLTYSRQWEWVFSLILTNTIYFFCIVKVSLKSPETQSETILKSSFNSLLQNQVQEYFQVIQTKGFIRSILRGMVPPQFSFCYLKGSQQRRIQIYSMINYIYSSIEAVVYYPFFIVYTSYIYSKEDMGVSWIYYTIAVSLIILSELIFVSLTLYLIVFGCRKKGFFKNGKKC